MDFTYEKFNEIKKDAEKFYSNLKSIHCPFFQEKIHFNSKGFDHLIFKSFNKTRVLQDQFSRLKYIKFAPQIISNSKTLQGYLSKNKIERVKSNKKWQKVMKVVVYYEFIAICDIESSKVRFKVIVKQVQGGEKYFLSIIPFWGIDKATGEKKLHSGNLEND